MTDASLALQKAVVAILRANAAVVGLVGQRTYDRVPSGAVYPLVEVADGQTLDAGAECLDGVEVFLDLHVWSRAVGRVECRSVAGAVRAALHGAEPALEDGWRLVDLRHRDTRFLSDPDGITTHAVVTVRALIDPT